MAMKRLQYNQPDCEALDLVPETAILNGFSNGNPIILPTEAF